MKFKRRLLKVMMKKWRKRRKIVTLKKWLELKLDRRYKNTRVATKKMAKRKVRKKMKR
jgi:hypothetical protein